MANRELSPGEIVSNGIKLGMSNFVPLLLNGILFGLTFWIPYINIGTMIAMGGGLTVAMSKGKTISATEIFNPGYRKYFGEYFLQTGLMMMAIYASIITLIGPLILSLSWMLAPGLMLDGKAEPGVAALKKSNELTYGNKMSIFLAMLLLEIGLIVAGVIFSLIPYVGMVLLLALVLLVFPIILGMGAYVYQQLAGDEVGSQGSAQAASVDEFAK